MFRKIRKWFGSSTGRFVLNFIVSGILALFSLLFAYRHDRESITISRNALELSRKSTKPSLTIEPVLPVTLREHGHSVEMWFPFRVSNAGGLIARKVKLVIPPHAEVQETVHTNPEFIVNIKPKIETDPKEYVYLAPSQTFNFRIKIIYESFGISDSSSKMKSDERIGPLDFRITYEYERDDGKNISCEISYSGVFYGQHIDTNYTDSDSKKCSL